MGTITFATAGNIDKDILSSIRKLKDLGLKGQEVEFVRGVTMGNEKAIEAGKLAKELGIKLSIHAPFYINLVSDEKSKIHASMHRIIESCERGYHLGVKNVVFHAAFYGKRDKEEVYEMVKERILEMQEILKEKGWDSVKLSPETTGKKTQFGDLDELLRLRKETGCSICVDFAHLLAREGEINYSEVFKKLDGSGIKTVHSHFSGIEYTAKGERRHLPTLEENFLPLFKEALKHKVNLHIVNESPIPLEDALKGKKLYEELLENNNS